MGDENKIKILGEENFRLLEVLRMTREGAAQLDKRNRELKAIADAAVGQTKNAELKCAEYEREIERLGKVREEGEKALAEVESVCAAAVSEQKRFAEENARLSKELEVKTAEETKLLEKIKELEAEGKQKESEIKAIQEALAQQGEAHRLAVEEYETRHRKTDQQFKALQERLEDERLVAQKLDAEKTASLAALGEAKGQLESELKKTSDALADLKTEVRRLNEMSEQKQEQIRELEEEKQNLIADLQSKAAEKTRLLEEIRAWDAKCAGMGSEIKAAQEALAQQEEAHRLAVEKHEAQHQKAAEVTHVLENDKKALLSGLAEKTEEISRLRVSLQEAGETLEKMNVCRRQMEEKLLKADEDIKGLQSEKRRLEEEKSAAQKLDAKRTASIAELEGTRDRLENEKARLEGDLKTSWKEQEGLKDEIRRLNEVSDQKQGKIETLEEEKQSLIKDLKIKAAEKTQLLEEIRDWARKCGEMEDAIKSDQEAHRRAVAEHEARHQKADQQYKALQERLEEEQRAARKLDEERTASFARLEEAHGKLGNEKARLESELADSSKERVNLNDEIRRLNEVSERKQGQIQALEEEKQNLIEDLETKVAEKARLLEGIREWEGKCAERESEIKANQEALERQEEAHRLAIKEHEAQHYQANELAKGLREEARTVAAQLVEKTVEESRLRAALQEAGENLEKLNARCRELEGKLQKTDDHCNILRSEKNQLEDEKRAARKLDEEKTASLAKLEENKGRLESELKTAVEEIKDLKEEFHSAIEGHEARHRKAEENSRALQSEIRSLTETVHRTEALLREKEAALAALEKSLKEEKKIRAEAQAHSEELEKILVSLEKKINDIS